MLTLFLCLLGFIYILAHMQPFINRIRDIRVGPELPRSRDTQSSDPTGDQSEDDGSYKPTPIDIVVTRALMTRGLRLPPDIVDAIFDFAEYWAHSSNEFDYLLENKAAKRIIGRSAREDQLLVRSFPVGLTGLDDREDLADILQYKSNETKPRPLRREHPPSFFSKLARYPTPRLAHPVRKIVFTTRSRDQGHGVSPAESPYDSGWTWMDAGLERFDADQICDAQCASDLRLKSPTSVPPSLPLCALRPIYPTFYERPKPEEPTDKSNNATENAREPDYAYDHGFMPPEDRLIQRNRTRNRQVKTHVVVWSWTDDIKPESDGGLELKTQGRGRGAGDGWFVRSLKLGDVVTVWGKAKFPAWVNNIEKVKVEVYWAV